MTVNDLPSLHRRYVDLAGRFKAAWTFHQFLQGMQKFFVAAQIPRYPTDLAEIHAALKRVSENLTGNAGEQVDEELDQASQMIDQTIAELAAADVRVTPPLLRQFFERVKNYDDQILAQMVRFYLSLAAEEGLVGDRLDKVDFLVTKLAEEVDPVSGAAVLRDRSRLRSIFEGFWTLMNGLSAEVEWIDERRSEVAGFRRELAGMHDLASFSASQIVPRYREVKRLLGRYLFHPDLLLAVVETNLAFKNRVRRNFEEEEQRILDESQRILEMESQPQGVGATADLSQLRRTVEDVERKREADNLKIDDLGFLRRQIDELRPRLVERHGVAPRPAGGDDSQEDGVDEALLPHYRELVQALEGADNRADVRDVALSRDLYEFRLEPREVQAYRRIYVTPDGDPTLERFLLEAAALRHRITVEATEISELLDETAVTRDAPVFEQARRTTRLSEGFIQRFGGYLDDAVRANAFGEVQHIQLLRMRLIRDYSGLWLLANRPKG